MHRSRLLLATLPLVLLAACGGDDADGRDVTAVALDEVPDDALEVVGTEMAFDPDELQAPAGTVTFVLDNQGRLVHDIVVDGVQVAEAPGGAMDAGAIDLEPGTYELWCSVPGHRGAGMEASLEVTGD